MKLDRSRVLLLTSLFISIHLVYSMEEMPGAIKGYVRDASTTTPIEGATVEVYNQTASKSTSSGPDGIYIAKMPQGTYNVTCTTTGYIGQTKSVTLVSGEYTYQDFYLEAVEVDADGDGYNNTVDCDDSDAGINPGAVEVCGDGVDQNCDGVDMACSCPDVDGDGYFDAACGGNDCNDANASINPGAGEIPYDGVDQDCDGFDTIDQDNDGYNYTVDCNDSAPGINPGATEVCDSVDNDCDGSVDEGVMITYYRDADADGYGDFSQSTQACSAPSVYVSDDQDCDDTNASIHPGAVEVCGDGVDQNCDGVDMACSCPDVDGDGYSDVACGGSDCNDANGSINPDVVEIPYDGIDQDCDGFDTIDVDEDGHDYTVDCIDTDASINPDAAETCDGIDNDCDGNIDEGCPKTPTGGGGGGGGAAKGTIVKKIDADGTETASFELKDTGYISEIALTSKETVYNIKIVVEPLEKKPYLSMPDPGGVVLSYMKLTKSGISNTQFEKATVNFQVPVSWLVEYDISQSKVYLKRDAGTKWAVLETTYLSEDDKFAYYKAVTPGFSYFVITGEEGSGYLHHKDRVAEVTPQEIEHQVTPMEPPVYTGLPATAIPTEKTTNEPNNVGVPAREGKEGICGPTVVGELALLSGLLGRRKSSIMN
jgi:PGF-pre-PGF domain-containing protein